MFRGLLTYIVPFLMPIAGYAAWIWYRTQHAQTHGGQAPKFEQGPWPLMLFLGAVLSFAVLAVGALNTGGKPGDIYIPPHVENGKIVPGRTQPKP